MYKYEGYIICTFKVEAEDEDRCKEKVEEMIDPDLKLDMFDITEEEKIHYRYGDEYL